MLVCSIIWWNQHRQCTALNQEQNLHLRFPHLSIWTAYLLTLFQAENISSIQHPKRTWLPDHLFWLPISGNALFNTIKILHPIHTRWILISRWMYYCEWTFFLIFNKTNVGCCLERCLKIKGNKKYNSRRTLWRSHCSGNENNFTSFLFVTEHKSNCLTNPEQSS